MYKIGSTTYFMGKPVTIITKPYELYGAMWQDAETGSGNIVTLVTPEQQALNIERSNAWREEQQAGFRRLKEL